MFYDIISLVQLAPETFPAPSQTLRFAEELADILNNDEELGRVLGRTPRPQQETAQTVLRHARTWCGKHDAIFFAIVLDQEAAIGTISLSHMDPQCGSARTGYWIGTPFQGRGYGGLAFRRLVAFAQALGVRSLSGQIGAANHASRRIWERNGASIAGDGSTLRATLPI
ncbi:MAG TPA: GNAT family N-acetyltransferase [Magnetospirillum sp.]|nr:GNAT family N-acetyltransferase [Magnetospirillum sp.]